MSLVINHNMMAMNAARNLGEIYGRLARSTQRLSSGLRINSAGDDAAGLAIRELMRSDIAVMQQGARNAADGISMIQTAEGAMAVMDEKLTRMKELAEQAATGIYTTVQREIMNSEYIAMANEIDRIANATEFAGTKLLDGSISAIHQGQGMKIHFGTGNSAAEDYYFIKIGDVRATSDTGLRIGGDALNDIWGTAGTGDATGGGGCCGGGITSLTEPAGWASGAVFSYGYNHDLTEDVDGNLDHPYYIGGLYQMASGASLQDLITAVNRGSQSRVRLDFAAGTSGGTLIGSGSGFSVCIGDEAYYWGTGIVHDKSDDYAVDATITASSALVGAINNSGGAFWAMQSGDTVWIFAKEGGDHNDWRACDQAFGGSGGNLLLRQDLATWYNMETEQTNSAGTLFSLGGYDWGYMRAIPTASGSYGVTLEGADVGAERDLWILDAGSGASFDINTAGWAGAPTTITGLGHDAFFELQNAADGRWDGAHIRTQSHAQEALDAIQSAIERKDIVRANLGAYQNRLENTITNLNIMTENLQASESRISDVDVATEMTEFTRNNIMAQAAVSMLGQANSLPQLALTLLG
jgi:flagellin